MRFLPVVVLLCVAGYASADTELVFDDNSTVLIRDGKVLFGDKESGVLYPGSGDAMMAVNWQDEEYIVIDKEFTASVASQVGAAMKQMEAQLAQMPPEQQAMMREMLKDSMPAMTGAAPQERSYRMTGKKREVAGFKCTEGQVLLNGEPEQEVCSATARELGMPDKDYAALRTAFMAMSRIAREFREAADMSFDLDALDGVPVSTRELPDGKRSKLVSVSTAKISPDRLAVPEHFQRRDPREGF